MAQPTQLLTVDEYLALEREGEGKHEFLNGELFAMAGASRRHNLITANLVGELRAGLRRGPCGVYPSDMRLEVDSSGLFTYPDVSVARSEPSFEDQELDTLTNPTVLIEVLSKSTAAYDLGKKFEQYRTIDSVQEILFVDSETTHVMIYRRQGDTPPAFGTWIFTETRDPGAVVPLSSLDLELPSAEIYSKVGFDPQPVQPT